MKLVYLGKYNQAEKLTGPEKVAKRLYNLCPASIQVTFIDYFRSWSNFGLIKKIFGSRKYECDDREVCMLGIVPLFNFLVKFRPDVIHIVTFEKFTLVAFLYKIFFRSKIVYTMHGLIQYESRVLKKNMGLKSGLFERWAERIIINNSDKLVLLSNRSINLLEEFGFLDKVKIKIIPNGIDEMFFNLKDETVTNTILNILFIGDLSRQEKGVGFLKRFVESSTMELKINIISDDESGLIQGNNLVDVNIIRKSEVKEYMRIIQMSDIYLSLSNYESYSISAAECVASGLVGILTEDTGVSEYITDGESGFIVSYGDTNLLIEIIARLNRDRFLLGKISSQGRNALKNLTWPNVSEKYIKLYKSLL